MLCLYWTLHALNLLSLLFRKIERRNETEIQSERKRWNHKEFISSFHQFNITISVTLITCSRHSYEFVCTTWYCFCKIHLYRCPSLSLSLSSLIFCLKNSMTLIRWHNNRTGIRRIRTICHASKCYTRTWTSSILPTANTMLGLPKPASITDHIFSTAHCSTATNGTAK